MFIYVLCEVATVSQLCISFPHVLHGLCEDYLTCDIAFNAVMPLSRASTRVRYSRIEGVTLVLNYLPGNTGDVRWLPCKHINIRPQEGNERAFLFAVERGTDGEGTTRAVLLGGHLLGCRRSGHPLLTLAGGARWNVLDGGAALRRGAVAGVGPRALAGLGPCLLPPGSFSGKCVLFCRSCYVPVDLVGADK